MREILFRGKRIDNGEWVEGNLFIPDKVTRLDVPTEILVGTNVVRISYEVDPSTVGQYTGLTDKNGKKIFEGDRIEIRGYVYCCCWDEGNLEFMLINKKESFGMGYAASSRMNVIGNVHDNPELLEVDDETD